MLLALLEKRKRNVRSKMDYIYRILVALDQLANAIIGGNPDVTLSGHVGHMSQIDEKWITLLKIIDGTFAPIEKNHCIETWLADEDVDRTDNYVLSGCVVVLGCTILYLPIRILKLFLTKFKK